MNSKHHSYGAERVLLRLAAFITALSAVVLFLPFAGINAYAATNEANLQNFVFGINAPNGTFVAYVEKFTPVDDSAKTNVQIPDTYKGYKVTSIASSAFEGTAPVKVTIPATVTSIGPRAFKDCSTLTDITLPNGITEIPDYAFSGCYSLKKIAIPDSVTRIGFEAFAGCTALTDVTFSKGGKLTTIGQCAFLDCTSVQTLTIPDSVTSIGAGAFERCASLKTIILPNGLKTIDDSLLYNCVKLDTVVIPPNVTSIGGFSFFGCTSLTAIEIPKSVQSIGTSAFAGCTSLQGAKIPIEVQNISDSAFATTNYSIFKIYGYTGSYAYYYASRNGHNFYSYGSVYNVTFSANIYTPTSYINIKTSDSSIVPEATVIDGESLTITALAPADYDVDYITINGQPFVNGSTYRVNSADVNIYVAYRLKDATTTTTPATAATIPTGSSTFPTVAPISTSADTTVAPPADTTGGDSYITVDSSLEDVNGVNVKIITQRDYFIGPATIRITNTPEATEAARNAISSVSSNVSTYYAFDISIYDQTGKQNQGVMARGSVTFQIPVPQQLLQYADSLRVYHIVDENPELINSSIIQDMSGVRRVQFETDSFSPYMFVVDSDEMVPIIDDETTRPADTTSYIAGPTDQGSSSGPDAEIVTPVPTPTPTPTPTPSYNGNLNPHTGVMIAVAIPVLTLICVLLVKSRRKRKRAKISLRS